MTDTDVRTALSEAKTDGGDSLLELSRQGDVLLVFLRHLGCTFCREAVADLSEQRQSIEGDAGTKIVFVYMPGPGDTQALEARASRFFAKHGMEDSARVADPDKRLYRAFGLGRGSLGQLFGWKNLKRGFVAGVMKGHLVGPLVGDGFQMPGVFLVRDGAVVAGYRHETAADVPDYCAIAHGENGAR